MTYKPSFHSTDSFGDKSLLVNLENNMKSFLTWGFLNIGGYVDVKIPTSNINSFNQHILRPSKDKTAANYTVWQSPKKDWVYESGVDYQGSSPIAFSGLYIDSSFYPAPTGSGSVSYTVDYPNGQIFFGSPVPISSVVSAEYNEKKSSINSGGILELFLIKFINSLFILLEL